MRDNVKDKTHGKKIDTEQQLIKKKKIHRGNLIINFQLGATGAIFSPVLFSSEDNKCQYAFK